LIECAALFSTESSARATRQKPVNPAFEKLRSDVFYPGARMRQVRASGISQLEMTALADVAGRAEANSRHPGCDGATRAIFDNKTSIRSYAHFCWRQTERSFAYFRQMRSGSGEGGALKFAGKSGGNGFRVAASISATTSSHSTARIARETPGRAPRSLWLRLSQRELSLMLTFSGIFQILPASVVSGYDGGRGNGGILLASGMGRP